MATDAPLFTRHERAGETVQKLIARLAARIEEVRDELEKPANNPERTASLRGKVAAYREIQALTQGPERPPAEQSPGED